MNKERVSYKEEALSFLSRREWKKAMESFQKHIDQEPEDLRSRLKMAELSERLGRKKEAIAEYRQVAEAYAKEGFLLQAISVNKMILRIDPLSKDINEQLTHLYMARARETKSIRSLPPIPLLSDLEEGELQTLLGRVQFKAFPKGSFVCREGEPGDSLMVICQGQVGVYKHFEGREVWIRNLKEGDCFGEFGFFLDRKRHASVKSLMDCETIEITRNELEEIIKNHPRVREVLEDLFKKRVLDNLLGISPLFSPLSGSDREEVLNRFRMVNLPEETYVFKGGEPPDSLYLIKSGEVEIFTQNRHKKPVTLGKLGSGHLFGEIGVLLNTPRMAFAKTTHPTELFKLSKADFDDLVQKFPHLQSIGKEISSKRLIRMRETLSKELMDREKESMV
jgi:cAMP-dependent protein kinase regulator